MKTTETTIAKMPAERRSARAFETGNRCIADFLFAKSAPLHRAARLHTRCEAALSDGSYAQLDFELAELLATYRDALGEPRAAIEAYAALGGAAALGGRRLTLSELELSKCYAALGTTADARRFSLAELLDEGLLKAS